MVDEHKALPETAAGLTLREQMAEMQRTHEADIARVRNDAKQDTSMLQQELEAIRAEQASLKDARASQTQTKEIDARIKARMDPTA